MPLPRQLDKEPEYECISFHQFSGKYVVLLHKG